MGIDIDHGVDRAVRISQGSYIQSNILERFGFEDVKPAITPFRKKSYQKHDACDQPVAFASAPTAAATGGPNVTVAPGSNAATGAASNPPGAKARHQSLCTHFVRDALAFRFINPKYAATENQFADVFTKAPTAPVLRLLKTLMDGAARVPLLARLYQ